MFLPSKLANQATWERGSKIGNSQARKRNPNPNFLVRISSNGMGVFEVKGWGPKSSVCTEKRRETKLFAGISGIFGGISRRCPKSLRTKKFVLIFGPQIPKVVTRGCAKLGCCKLGVQLLQMGFLEGVLSHDPVGVHPKHYGQVKANLDPDVDPRVGPRVDTSGPTRS